MTDVSSHIHTDAVSQMTCEHCRAELDVSGLPSFSAIECPQCAGSLTVPARLGTFSLLKLLGQGGMGAVYEGIDTSLDRPVAIKVLLRSVGEDPAFVETFQKEAKAAAALNHPNIVQIYQFGHEKGQPYIVMELLLGGRLDKMISSGKRIDPALIVKIAIDIANGLGAAGDIGLVHGDVKPENILMDAGKTAKIVDFGLAAFMDRENRREGVWGTPYYIAPEKVMGKPGDIRSDIYSLGATLFHALTLQPPFEGEGPVEVVKARLHNPAPPVSSLLPNIHPEIERVVARMLEAQPQRRYPTYVSLIADLSKVVGQVGPPRTLTRFNRSSSKITISKPTKSGESDSRTSKSDSFVSVPSKQGTASKSSLPSSKTVRKKRGGGRWIAVLLFILLLAGAVGAGWWQWQEYQAALAEEARREHIASVVDEAGGIFAALDEKADAARVMLEEAYPSLQLAADRLDLANHTLRELGVEEGMSQVSAELARTPERMLSEMEKAEASVALMRNTLLLIGDKRANLKGVRAPTKANGLLIEIQAQADALSEEHATAMKHLETFGSIYQELDALDELLAEKKAQLAESERLRQEEAERQRELEARQREEAEHRRLLAEKTEAEARLVSESRAESLPVIRRNEFEDALDQARRLRERLETEPAQAEADLWIARLSLLNELKDMIIEQLDQARYSWGWLGQRDVIGADRQSVHLPHLKVPWNEVPARQMLRFIGYYSGSENMDRHRRARFNLAAAAYCYENNALPLAQTYARQAKRDEARLEAKIMKIMPELKTVSD